MTIAPAFRVNFDVAENALSEAIAIADYLVAYPLMPGAPAPLRRLRPGEDLLRRITNATTALDQARQISIEGGNPIGEEASLLLTVLVQVERLRRFEKPRAERFALLAHELRSMVKGNLGKLLERRQAPAKTTETGRNG